MLKTERTSIAEYGHWHSSLGKEPTQKCWAETRRKMHREGKFLQKGKLFTAGYSSNLALSSDSGETIERWCNMYELIFHSNISQCLVRTHFRQVIVHELLYLGGGGAHFWSTSAIKNIWWYFLFLDVSPIKLRQEGLLTSQQTSVKQHWVFHSLEKKGAEKNKKGNTRRERKNKHQAQVIWNLVLLPYVTGSYPAEVLLYSMKCLSVIYLLLGWCPLAIPTRSDAQQFVSCFWHLKYHSYWRMRPLRATQGVTHTQVLSVLWTGRAWANAVLEAI